MGVGGVVTGGITGLGVFVMIGVVTGVKITELGVSVRTEVVTGVEITGEAETG